MELERVQRHNICRRTAFRRGIVEEAAVYRLQDRVIKSVKSRCEA